MKTSELKNFIRSGGYAWPGGYPTVLVMSDGEILCAAAARENYRLIRQSMKDKDRRSGWYPEGVDIHWEGEPLICAHTGREIESAYGTEDL